MYPVSLLGTIVENVIDMIGYFGDIAAVGPVSAFLLLVGSLLLGVSVAVLGGLTAGAALDLVTRE